MLRTSVLFKECIAQSSAHIIFIAPQCFRHWSHFYTCAASHAGSGSTQKKLSFGLGLLPSLTASWKRCFWATRPRCQCPLALWWGAGLAQSHPTGTKQAQGEMILDSYRVQCHLAGLQMHKMRYNDLKNQVHVFIKAYCSSELDPKLFNHFIFKMQLPISVANSIACLLVLPVLQGDRISAINCSSKHLIWLWQQDDSVLNAKLHLQKGQTPRIPEHLHNSNSSSSVASVLFYFFLKLLRGNNFDMTFRKVTSSG